MCQMKHFCTWVLKRCNPYIYYRFPKFITSLWYASVKGFFPRLNNPRDFNEKLLGLNLDAYRDETKRSLLIRCADKYEVRQFVKERGLQSLLNECYGVYNSFADIDFNSLPEQFVLKFSTGSGQNFICENKSKLDLMHVRQLVDNWFAEADTFGLKTGEWHYSAIQPRIVIEKYLPSLAGSLSLIDYKFLCIRGKVVGILVCYDRLPEAHQLNLDLYDLDWNKTDGVIPAFHKNQRRIPRPQCLDEMILIAETLSAQIDFVRVDLYDVEGSPVFGEMTFTPAGNVMSYFCQWVLDNMLRVYNGEIDAHDCLCC